MLEVNEKADKLESYGFKADLKHHSKRNHKTLELLTIISLKDNPTLNLAVAQPSVYKVEESNLGTGILAYSTNELDALRHYIKQDEMIIKIDVSVDISRVLNLYEYRDKEYLRLVHESLNSQFESDNEFLNRVYIKGNRKFDLVHGTVELGEPLFKDSRITEYMNHGYLILNENIIQRADTV